MTNPSPLSLREDQIDKLCQWQECAFKHFDEADKDSMREWTRDFLNQAIALSQEAATAPVASEPVAWACTDYDGHVGIGLTQEEAKRNAGEMCNEFFPLYAQVERLSQIQQQAVRWANAIHKLLPKLMIDCNTLDDLEAWLRHVGFHAPVESAPQTPSPVAPEPAREREALLGLLALQSQQWESYSGRTTAPLPPTLNDWNRAWDAARAAVGAAPNPTEER